MSEQRNIIIDNIDFSEALRYLGYGNSTPDEKTKEILYNCADQLKSVMEGKYTYKVFDLVDGQVPGINFTLECVAQVFRQNFQKFFRDLEIIMKPCVMQVFHMQLTRLLNWQLMELTEFIFIQ